MTDPEPRWLPGCRNMAVFRSEAQARYVQTCLLESEPGPWHVTVHGDHWHVEEIDPEDDDGR